MEINLHIERLVLDGVDIASGKSDAIQTSVTNELTRLFNSGAMASKLVDGASLYRINASSIHLRDEKPQALGRQIAKSVFGSINL